MRRCLAIAPLVFAWFCANGALWDVMQVAAWGRMFAGYSQTMAFPQALRETLDPDKPCEMCLCIAQAKSEAEKSLPAAERHAASKLVLISQPVERPVFCNDRGEWDSPVAFSALQRAGPVRLRPPRA